MKILIIRFSSIGDIVLTTPVIRCVKTQVPDAEVHFLSKERFSSILTSNKYIDKLHTLKEGESMQKLLARLRDENYDWVLDLHNNLRTMLVKTWLRPFSNIRSFDKLNFRKWLLVKYKLRTMPALHIVDRYLATAHDLGVKNDGKGLDYFIAAEDDRATEILGSELVKRYVALCIGGQHETKKLPVDKLIELCKKIQQPLIILGGKEDIAAAEEIVGACGPELLNFCGKLSLGESASIIKNADWVISHDTGMMHVAAAFNKKIISIWGNTVPEFGMYPYQAAPESFMMEVMGLPCRPCSKIGYKHCPQGHFKCMREQDLEKIEIVNQSTAGMN